VLVDMTWHDMALHSNYNIYYIILLLATITTTLHCHPSGNLGKGGVGESGGIDPWTEAPDLSRVLVAVDKGPAVVGRLLEQLAVVIVEAGRQLQGGSALVGKVGNVVGEAARAILVLAFGPVIRRKGKGMEGRYRRDSSSCR